jgi:hypothetical protein
MAAAVKAAGRTPGNEEVPKELPDGAAISHLQGLAIDRTRRSDTEEQEMDRRFAWSRLARPHHRYLRVAMTAGVMAMALASAGVTSAHSDNAAVREPVGNTPGDLDSSICGFPIHVEVVSDREYVIHSSTLADGTLVLRFTGLLVERFTNMDTGKSATANVGGPVTLTLFPDGSVLFDGQGLAWFYFDAVGRAATGEPGLVFTAGHAIDHFGPNVEETFTLSGSQVDGCRLLAG